MPPPTPATMPSADLREVADLRLHALHQRRQVGMRLRPERMELLADDRPFRDARARRAESAGYCPARLARIPAPNRPSEPISTARGRHDQHGAEERDQRGRQALLAAEPARQPGAADTCDGQDQCPDHQGQERREDPVAQHATRAKTRPARISTSSSCDPFPKRGVGVGLQGCVHRHCSWGRLTLILRLLTRRSPEV